MGHGLVSGAPIRTYYSYIGTVIVSGSHFALVVKLFRGIGGRVWPVPVVPTVEEPERVPR